NQIASGSSTNDFPEFPRHFLSPVFRDFSENTSFSTATPVRNIYLDEIRGSDRQAIALRFK
ncbi:MAG: hypothetical protein WBQ04_12405, partial [Candidatus Acidiferrales bacterium]